MIRVCFLVSSRQVVGFEMKGHSGYAAQGSDIVCAAASSCAYMAANTITDVIGAGCEVEARDAFMRVVLRDFPPAALAVLEGLRLHLKALSQEYSANISCCIKAIKLNSEVQTNA